MMKQGSLLLLLAVIASQVNFSVQRIHSLPCEMNFYGRKYALLQTSLVGSAAEFCFKDNSTHPAGDCLVVKSQLTGSDISLTGINLNTSHIRRPSQFYQALPNFTSNPNCSYIFRISHRAGVWMELHFFQFSQQRDSAVRISPSSLYNFTYVNVTAKLGNSVKSSWWFTSTKNHSYISLSGCRQGAGIVSPSYVRQFPQSCARQVCHSSGRLVTYSNCKYKEICLGNNRCHRPDLVCTVSGSTVIDFFNKNHSIPDRCVYSLMKPHGKTTFDLLAVFQERRRKDVAFLDHLILWLKTAGVKIYLEQGGRVRVDNQVLRLNSTQVHHSVKLSKDQTGVTAKLLSAKVTVFFDGNTAHVSGPDDITVKGLCGITKSSNVTTVEAERSLTHSTAGCEIQHSDTLNRTSNCSVMTQRCNLMRQAAFSICNKHINPKHFINACTDTFCKYPMMDGHKCQFLEAYAKTCTLRLSVTLGNWRSASSCPAAPQVYCQERYCSAHEFCGDKLHGGTRCFCRAVFASKYKANNHFGEPTVCTQNSGTLSLAGCLLEDKGIDHSVLHLQDKNCTGEMDSRTHMVSFSFNASNTCGTEIMMNNSQIIYKNSIMTRNSSLHGIITRHDEVQIDFSCYYNQPEVKSVSFKIKDSSVVQQIVSGVWNYTLMMNAYTDPALKKLVGPTTEIQLNQKIWVELKTEGLDDKLISIVTVSCWATHEQSPNASLRYDLIKNKCANPADETVRVMGNGLGTSNSFSFNMFEFSGKTSEVYLHCKLELCPRQSRPCAPTCSGGGARRRRSSTSKYADEHSALISMAWTK